MFSWGGLICRCVVASEWNVEGGRLYVAGFLHFSFVFLFWLLKECWIDGLGRCSAVDIGMRVSFQCFDFTEMSTNILIALLNMLRGSKHSRQ